MGASKNSIKPMMARRERAKKRTTAWTQEVGQRREQLPSLHGVNEHFELVCNAVSTASADF